MHEVVGLRIADRFSLIILPPKWCCGCMTIGALRGSALTPSGPWLMLLPLRIAGFKLVSVASGPDDRVVMRVGREVLGVLEA